MELLNSITDLQKGIIVPHDLFDGVLKRCDWTWQQIAAKQFPPPFVDLQSFQMAIICSDRVLWSAAFLRSPEDGKSPYTFWEYQKQSLNDSGNTLHQCGFETGKTREILAFMLYEIFNKPNGSGLMTAPQSVHTLEIVDGLVDQLSNSPALKKCLIDHRKQPHHNLKFNNRFELDIRTCGHDGTQLRGVHAKTFCIFDETPKAKNDKIFTEFWGRGEPGAVFKLYGMPDGDRSCVHFKLCNRAEGKLKDEEAKEIGKAAPTDFTLYKWAKNLQPAPYWTEERRRFYIDQYHGEDSSGYRQAVLGEWGDPENSVFPWKKFEPLVKEIKEYRCLKIFVDDSAGEASIYGYELRSQIQNGQTGKPEPVTLVDRRIGRDEFDIAQEIKAFFSGIPGLTCLGADLGFSQDPTEIYIKLIIGKVHRLVARVQLKGVSYDQQADAIDAMDDVFDSGKQQMGLGLDFGNAGSAVVHILQGQERYAGKNYQDRLTGYQFGSAYDAINEDGELILDKNTNKPVRSNAKELSTDLLTAKMYRQELEYPFDPDIVLMYPNHTYRQGTRHRIFKDIDDHVIDADRVLTLRVVLPGDSVDDLFATGS
jgi:hypothetical protein